MEPAAYLDSLVCDVTPKVRVIRNGDIFRIQERAGVDPATGETLYRTWGPPFLSKTAAVEAARKKLKLYARNNKGTH